MDQDDLISIGTIGLIKAINTFNVGKGARLATYAAKCIDNEILMYFRNQKKTIQDVSMSDVMEQKNQTSLKRLDYQGFQRLVFCFKC